MMNPFTLRYTDKQVIFMKLGQDTNCGESIWEAQEIKEGRVVRVHYKTVEDDSTPQKIAEALGYFNTPIDGVYGSYNKVTFNGVTYIRQINFPRQWDAFRDDKWIGGFSLYQDDPKPTDLESALNFIEKGEELTHFEHNGVTFERSRLLNGEWWSAKKGPIRVGFRVYNTNPTKEDIVTEAKKHFWWSSVDQKVPKSFTHGGIEYQRLHGEGHGWVARGNGYRVAMDLEGKDDTKSSVVEAFEKHPGFARLTYRKPEFYIARTSLEMVKEFHEKFDHPVNDKVFIKDPKLNRLRIKLLQEELNELDEALYQGNKEKVLDALSDLQVVLDGAFLSLGYHRVKDEALAETHRSNMSKLGADGKPIHREDGKILKGPSFSEPDYTKILKKV